MLSGYATPDATQAYADAHPEIAYRPLADSGLLVSPAGFGGYRVDAESSVYHEALRYALQNGINLIDTSSNYGGGGSEELVGIVLRRLHKEGEVPREAVVVVSKGGYLQGQNYQISQQRKASGQPWPELVEYGEGLEHCIHPDFLEDQITRSLRRLQLETLDVYLLHNPEYYLNWAAKQEMALEDARTEYSLRLRSAFTYLEEEVSRGRIRSYGISSNTFPSPADAPGYTSLSRVWEIAQVIGPENHFRVIQLPMNILETGAATEANQPEGESVLAFAGARELAVLVNRPLNAIRGNQMTRLADVEVHGVAHPEVVEKRIEKVLGEEIRFRTEILPLLEVEEPVEKQLVSIFSAGRLLQWRWQGFGSYHNWNDMQTRYLVPRLQMAVDVFTSEPELPDGVRAWLQNYVEILNQAMAGIDAIYAREASRQAASLKRQIGSADTTWGEGETLSQMAIRALRSTTGVTSVLVGMRRREYVEDVLAELQRPVEVEPRQDSWEKLATSG